jgi:hypothetical protein
VLGDFGLVFQDVAAAPIDQPKGAIPAMPQMYRTPELIEYQVTGKRPPPTSDVFQLGLVASELFTGKNPLRAGGPNQQVQLEPLDQLPGPVGATIKAQIEEMLVIDTKVRPPARILLPHWLDLYRTMIRHQRARQRAPVVRDPTAPRGGESAP